jgi:hypothetical protein
MQAKQLGEHSAVTTTTGASHKQRTSGLSTTTRMEGVQGWTTTKDGTGTTHKVSQRVNKKIYTLTINTNKTVDHIETKRVSS